LWRGGTASAQLAYFAIVTLAAIFAMLSISTPLWELAAPIVAFTQFPWRVLFVSSFALAFLAGASVRLLEPILSSEAGSRVRNERFSAALVLSLLLAFAMFPFAQPQYTETQFTWNTLMDFQVQDRELLGDTVWVETRPQDSPLVEQYRAGSITTKAIVAEGQALLDLSERGALGDTVQVDADTPARIRFYTRYFPGWTATVDGNAVPLEPSGEQGLLTLDVPAGSHIVTTRWGTTPVRIVGAVISLFSIAAAVLWLWRTRRA
jgi:hypothetical protein